MTLLIGSLFGLFAAAFLLGSVPFGLIVSKTLYSRDLRQAGSGNIGATNALRVLGKKGGALVFLLDIGKGALAGVLAKLLPGFAAVSLAAAALPQGRFAAFAVAAAFSGAVLGHLFSPWLRFHGGKGVAVAAGCILTAFGPLMFLIEVIGFALVVACTRYVSAGSLTAAVLVPFASLPVLWGHVLPWLICAVTAALVVWAHRANIKRLMAGTENKLGTKV